MTFHRLLTTAAAAAAFSLLASAALAQTTVKDAWVRGTVAQQMASGAFFQINSASGGKLVSASSPMAGVVEMPRGAAVSIAVTPAPVTGSPDPS